MRLVTLVENTAARETLAAEHGLSLYMEVGERRLLFDAGQSGAFAANADALGIDLSRVDTAVLSHGHYDHGGGLEHFLTVNADARIWMAPDAFAPHFNGDGRDIGLAPALRASGRIRYSREIQSLGDGLTLYTRIPCPRGIRSFGLTVRERGRLIPEDFRHEQYLLLEEAGRRVLISGCSHRGILNILEHFRPDVLIGGFHFMKLDPAGPELAAAAAELDRLPCLYYTGHCTGEEQYTALRTVLGEKLRRLSGGVEIMI